MTFSNKFNVRKNCRGTPLWLPRNVPVDEEKQRAGTWACLCGKQTARACQKIDFFYFQIEFLYLLIQKVYLEIPLLDETILSVYLLIQKIYFLIAGGCVPAAAAQRGQEKLRLPMHVLFSVDCLALSLAY